MKNYVLHFIRHGRTEHQRQGVYMGRRTGSELSAEGIGELLALCPEDIDLEDSGVELDTLRGLLGVDTALWRDEVKGIREFYQKFGDKLPRQLSEELDVLDARLN